jgi:uncharacterized protein with PhoU and TrkA domain
MVNQKKSKDTLTARQISERKLASGLVNLSKSTNHINFSTKDINAIVNNKFNSSMKKAFKKQDRRLDSMANIKK